MTKEISEFCAFPPHNEGKNMITKPFCLPANDVHLLYVDFLCFAPKLLCFFLCIGHFAQPEDASSR